MRVFSIIIFVVFFTTIIGCKKPYTPDAVTTNNNYLVVEGVINIGADSTEIKLSRTVNISSVVTTNPEPGATIAVESDQNTIYPLTEIKKGLYAIAGLNLDITRKYRLRIKTSNSQEYLSDLVAAQATPPIDSIGFNIVNTGVQIYLNTHDPQNSTHYYRWDYAETWQFHAKYQSDYISNGKEIVVRPSDQDIYSCFGNDVSSTILLGSSAKLSQDVIAQSPIASIAPTEEKIEQKYSILVRQYALSSDAYNFWINLKKNTEQLGSIFDAQPSNINGNIHNVANATEPVIGYISACSVQSKRIFISKAQLPAILSWLTKYPYDCEADSLFYYNVNSHQNQVAQSLIPLPASYLPIQAFVVGMDVSPSGYLASSPECVDCTIRGTKIQPAFWK